MKQLVITPILVSVIFIITSAGTYSFGQVKEADLSVAGSQVSEKVDTGDSPIKIVRVTGKGYRGGGNNIVTRVKLTDDNRVGYRLQNASDKAVRGYSLILVNGRENSVRMALFPGEPIEAGTELSYGYLLSNEDHPFWAFDWILFADGSSWGPDEHGRSKEILGYIKGRQTAIDRVADLVGYSATEPMLLSFKGRGLRSWAMNLTPAGRDFRDKIDHFKEGYDAVKQQLLYYSGKKSELYKQVADRLKEMELDRPR